jgi:hypothetical protein
LNRRGLFGCGHIPEMLANPFGRRQIDRAGVGFFLSDAGLRQVVNQRFGFDFQLAGQFVDSNLSFVCHPGGFTVSPARLAP